MGCVDGFRRQHHRQTSTGRLFGVRAWHAHRRRGLMPAPLYESSTEGAVALAAATAKTVIGAKAHANSGLLLSAATIAFDGVTASAVPVLIELSSLSWATNSPGTNSTSTTPRQ